ncbi:MAG: hypothetical protein HOJ79_05920 [Nitrospina sp.]|jgi:hypothetical protein|nr:hypothetical protein [Nitrospina sp.]
MRSLILIIATLFTLLATPAIGQVSTPRVKTTCDASPSFFCPNNSNTFSVKAYHVGDKGRCEPDLDDAHTKIRSQCLSACNIINRAAGPIQTSAWLKGPNGCSVEKVSEDLDPKYQALFAVACDTHDLCYAVDGVSKKVCDDEFKDNMDATCASSGLEILACAPMASIAYKAVQLGGKSSYDGGTNRSQEELCNSTHTIESIQIDCSVGGTSNAGTEGTHRISIYDSAGTRHHTGRYTVGSGCDDSDNRKSLAYLNIPSGGIKVPDFYSIKFQSRSNDALVIDKLILNFNDDYVLFWGTSNDVFFCLDTDLSTVGGTKCNRNLEYRKGFSGKVFVSD